jgi:hypothetical protein
VFELAVLRRTGNGEDIVDIGLLAETLLFYQRVHLLLDGSLDYLIKMIGPDPLLELLDRPGVSASFTRDNPCTLSSGGALRSHNFALIRFGPPGKAGKPKHYTDEEWLTLMLERRMGASRATKQFAKRLFKKVACSNYIDPTFGSRDLPTLAREDLKDANFVEQAMRSVLAALVPSFEVPSRWHFRALILGEQFAIDTDFDFALLNQEYHKTVPASHSTLTPEFLINHLLEARAAIFMGAKYLGELVVDPATSSIIKLKCIELMRKRDAQVNELDLFQELNLPNAKKVRECINSGERTFAEFLKLLDHAQKFKDWLGIRSPDQRLLQEYYRATTENSWLDNLGTKATRWAITTGLAAAAEAFYPTGLAMAGAQGISLLDATMLDRIVRGWRPNHFIEGRLGQFVSGD